jgi:hypothetical protein
MLGGKDGQPGTLPAERSARAKIASLAAAKKTRLARPAERKRHQEMGMTSQLAGSYRGESICHTHHFPAPVARPVI